LGQWRNLLLIHPSYPPSPSFVSPPGDIFVIEPLDFEASHEYYLTVEATDGGTPPLSDMATVNINLTDVNDNSPAFGQATYAAVVAEDAEPGKTVVAVS
jgi:protocadherin Fat 1/2/3